MEPNIHLPFSRRLRKTKKRLSHGKDYKESFKVFKKLLAKNTDEFCQNTTIHGLKYLTEKDLYPREKIFFGVSVIAVIVLAFYFVGRVIDKWSTTPVIFGFNPKPTLITQEPFPGVTICNLNVAYKSRADQYPVFSKEYAMLQLLCRKEVNITILNSIKDWSHLHEFITEISQLCSSMLISCRYGAIKYNCSELFRPILTDEGLCCAFNMVHPSFMYTSSASYKDNVTELAGFVPVHWSSETQYPEKLPEKFYPRVAVGTGETLGLSVILDAEVDEYYCSSANSVGFKMALHSPTELPSLREIGLLLATGRETKIRIQAAQVESEEHLRTIRRYKRHCLFDEEVKLDLFSHYTQRNCELECLAQMLLRYCGCISYYMPRLYGNETICSISDSTCVERIRVASMSSRAGNISCDKDCLPGCYDLSYLPDFFSTTLSHNGFDIASQKVKNMTNDYVERNIAIVHMYFKEKFYRSSKQTEFFGITDVLSSFGGLLGVFCGFSFISVAEFIFFAMIRPFRAAREVSVKDEAWSRGSGKKKRLSTGRSSTRRRYRRELGFKLDQSERNSDLIVSDLYMAQEFYRTKPFIGK